MERLNYFFNEFCTPYRVEYVATINTLNRLTFVNVEV